MPLKNGVVEFNQTLKLPVNMYFNTATQSFVEKKVNLALFSAYTVLLFRPKREKNQQALSLSTSPKYSTKEFIVYLSSIRTRPSFYAVKMPSKWNKGLNEDTL
jgi:hypothetical protein